jgi:hypothetical protein
MKSPVKCPKCVSWTKPYAEGSTVESKVNTFPVKPTLMKGKSAHVRIEPTITHPADTTNSSRNVNQQQLENSGTQKQNGKKMIMVIRK